MWWQRVGFVMVRGLQNEGRRLRNSDLLRQSVYAHLG